MYVITFYSFKGGVGRTLALVNVAAELSRLGRKVLLVDFDLEAPGIGTFNLPKPRPLTPGIVDYVTRYINTGEAPNVFEYIYESSISLEAEGKLWIMPAGKQDQGYGHRLNSINWQDLYEKHDGYLMFEDMKEQWKATLKPDYVLIDSRTGHTDVGGICTRQLPAAVCALFIPNQQNLAGLKKVVDDIRNEAKGDRKKTIQLHFVMSNVPDIDDEDRILEQWTDKFKDALGYKELAGTIHHYNSLDLLNQVIFSVDRQRSRLAKEYRTLLKALIRHNPEDRDGVLDFLRDVNRKAELDTGRIGISANELEDKLEKIRSLHAKDGDILYSLSTIKQRLGVINEALVLLSEAIDSGYRKSSAFMKRAELNSIIGNKEAARTDILEALNSSDNNYFTVSSAIMKLKELDPKALAKITSSSALTALDEGDVYQLANELSWSREELAIAEQLNQRLLQGAEKFQDSPFKEFAEINLSLCLIGLGRYKEAMELLGPNRESLESAGIISTFNYAMAEWAETEKPPRDLFELVIKLEAKGPLGESPNHQQCIAIAYWVTGGIEESKKYLERARQLMKARPRSEFSGWRYLRVEPDEFLEDLTSLEEMLDRKELRSPLKIKKSPRKKK